MKRILNRSVSRLFLLTALMLCAAAVTVQAAVTGVISGDVVNARNGPGTSYEVVEMLAKGKQVTILGEEAGWYHIQWNNSKGYVLKDYIALGSSGAQSTGANATVTGGATVNVRSGPGTSYSRVALVGEGKRVAVLFQSDDWYQVSFDGTTGYIFSDFLKLDGSGASQSSSSSQPASQAVDKSVGNATVTGGGTINVRSGPGTSYSRVTMVGEGKRVTAQDECNGWYHVSFGGTTGYILNSYLALDGGVSVPSVDPPAAAEAPAATEADSSVENDVPVVAVESSASDAGASAADARKGIINGGTINVRSGPGTEFERVTKVSTGKKVTILSEENGWLYVSFGSTTGYVLGEYVYEGDTLPADAGGVGAQVAAMAPQYLGVRYVYGGASTSGFDCSGFTMWLYKQFGYSLPHTASGQYANCGYKVSRSELQPGDLVFFASPGSGGSINHVGVYIGGGEFIHARYSVGQVYRNSLSENYYSTYYVGAIRIA